MSKNRIIRLMDIQEQLRNRHSDLSRLHTAYVYAAQKHRGQLRKSGEPYLSHLLNVAYILAEMNMDLDSVCAGLLHDSIEDTDATYDELVELFGEDIAFLVDGVTKIGKIKFKSKEEKQAENFRKMLVSMSKDVRVIIIKLADRLHNMRTIDHLAPEKRERIAQETIEIFAPLAHRLGIAWIRWELEDRSFRILEPDNYYEIYNKVKLRRTEREQYLNQVKKTVSDILEKENIPGDVSGRPKHFYSIYSKMKKKRTTFEEIYDLLALRILVDTIPQCYAVLGILHSMWKPIPGRFKDYIAMPKANMYQSLHTTLVGPKGMTVEFQIRTKEMHQIAEQGIAAHWRYKEGKISELSDDKSFVWLRQLLEAKELNKPIDFIEALKEDVLPTQIYVFTPTGDVMELPIGSTPIDFAYAIHTEVGNHCQGARVDGRMVQLKYRLKSGERVEIITSPSQEPRRDWLNIVKTNRAKTRIRSYLRKKENDRAIAIGSELLDKEFKSEGMNWKEVLDTDASLEKINQKLTTKGKEDIILGVGFGRISPKQVVHAVTQKEGKEYRDEQAIEQVEQAARARKGKKSEPFRIEGVDNVMISIARCCNPLPGDDIKGYISKGRGVIIHRADCKNLAQMALNEERLIDVEWDADGKHKLPVRLHTVTDDRPGMLNSLTEVMKDFNLNIIELSARPASGGRAKQSFSIEVADKEELAKLIGKLKTLKGVHDVMQASN